MSKHLAVRPMRSGDVNLVLALWSYEGRWRMPTPLVHIAAQAMLSARAVDVLVACDPSEEETVFGFVVMRDDCLIALGTKNLFADPKFKVKETLLDAAKPKTAAMRELAGRYGLKQNMRKMEDALKEAEILLPI